jgi:hypothetical protein
MCAPLPAPVLGSTVPITSPAVTAVPGASTARTGW